MAIGQEIDSYLETTMEDDVEFVDREEEAEETSPDRDRFGRTKEERDSMARLLVESMTQVYQSMEGKRKKIEKWRRQSEAIPEPRNARVINALRDPSNVVQPITQVHHQTLSANITSYFNVDPFFGFDSLKDDERARAKATFLVKYFDMLSKSPSDLNLAPVRRTIADETSLIGRCWVKIPWSEFVWRYKAVVEGSIVDKTITHHKGPEIVVIPPEDFIYPPQWKELWRCPWICHILHIPKHELKALGASNIYDASVVNEICNTGRTDLSAEQMRRLKDEGIANTYTDDVFDIGEFYFYDDVDGDGIVEEYIWAIDLTTMKVLREDYNSIGARPFEPFRWIPHTYDLDARGLGQTLDGLQDEGTTIANIRNDNMKVVSTRMLQMNKATQQANSEEIYAGKIWSLMGEGEIKPIQFGEVYPSSDQAIQRNWQTAAQASALSEVQRGFADPTLGQRDTFRGQAMRMNQAKGIFGTIADGMRESWNRIAGLIVLQLIAHKDEVIERERDIMRLSTEEIALLDDILSIEPSQVPSMFAFASNTLDSTRSKEGQLQIIQMVTQMYQAWAQGNVPLVQMLFSPQGEQWKQAAPELYSFFLNIVNGSTKLLESSMKLLGMDDASTFVPSTKMWDFMLSMVDQMTDNKVKEMEAQRGIINEQQQLVTSPDNGGPEGPGGGFSMVPAGYDGGGVAPEPSRGGPGNQ